MEFTCDHFVTTDWEDCHRLFKLPTDKATHPDARYTFPGLSRQVWGYQIYAVYLMLKQERTARGGGFLCDEMGLGKTTEILAHITASIALNNAWMAVQQSRSDRDGTHLPAENPPWPTCPSPERPPITCPCEKGSIAAMLSPKHGPSLIIVPPTLLANWCMEWSSCIKVGKHSATLLVGHSEIPEGFLSVSSGRNKLVNTPPEKRHQFVVITTRPSFEEHVFRYLSETKTKTVKKKRVSYREWVVDWGRIYRDEFHQEYHTDAKIFQYLQELKGSPYMWFASGTPYGKSVRELWSHIAVLQHHHDWTGDPLLQQYTQKHVKDIASRFRAWLREPQADREFDLCARHVQQLLRNTMVRRLAAQDWFGKPIVCLPPLWEHRKACSDCYSKKLDNRRIIEDIDNQIRRQINDARHKGLRNRQVAAQVVKSSAYHAKRFLSSFPSCAQIYNPDKAQTGKSTKVDLTWMQFKGNGWLERPRLSPYWTHRHSIWDQCSKLKALESIIQRRILSARDVDGAPAKLLVFSGYPMSCVLVDWWLQEKFPDLPASLLSSSVKLKQRQELVNQFQDPNAKLRVLVGSTAILGVGLTCTRAIGLVLMEPFHQLRDIQQSCARIHRQGQRNSTLFSYVLYTKGDSIEEKILAGVKEQLIIQYFAPKTTDRSLPIHTSSTAVGHHDDPMDVDSDDTFDYDKDDDPSEFRPRAIKPATWNPPDAPLPPLPKPTRQTPSKGPKTRSTQSTVMDARVENNQDDGNKNGDTNEDENEDEDEEDEDEEDDLLFA
jgi:SNF2 family DNA or RNA helicase